MEREERELDERMQREANVLCLIALCILVQPCSAATGTAWAHLRPRLAARVPCGVQQRALPELVRKAVPGTPATFYEAKDAGTVEMPNRGLRSVSGLDMKKSSGFF